MDLQLKRHSVPWLGGPTGVYFVVGILLIVLLSAARTVTHSADSMREHVAEEHYQTGLAEESAGNVTEAERRFRAALAVSRDHPPYRLALARVLLAQERWQEGENHLKELVRDDPTSGVLNLLFARARRADGDSEQAALHYQRAIHGYWDPGADRRAESRAELIEMLRLRKQWNRMIPELLQLGDQLPPDSPQRKSVARMFLEAGSPENAAKVWRTLHTSQPNDPEVHLGLGEAQLRLGEYREASASFRDAARLDPKSASAKQGLVLTQEVLTLNPMEGRLSAAARLQRTLRLTEAVLVDSPGCTDLPQFQEVRRLLIEARRRPGSHRPEDWLQRAEQLWKLRNESCVPDKPTSPALPHVFRLIEAGS